MRTVACILRLNNRNQIYSSRNEYVIVLDEEVLGGSLRVMLRVNRLMRDEHTEFAMTVNFDGIIMPLSDISENEALAIAPPETMSNTPIKIISIMVLSGLQYEIDVEVMSIL